MYGGVESVPDVRGRNVLTNMITRPRLLGSSSGAHPHRFGDLFRLLFLTHTRDMRHV